MNLDNALPYAELHALLDAELERMKADKDLGEIDAALVTFAALGISGGLARKFGESRVRGHRLNEGLDKVGLVLRNVEPDKTEEFEIMDDETVSAKRWFIPQGQTHVVLLRRGAAYALVYATERA